MHAYRLRERLHLDHPPSLDTVMLVLLVGFYAIVITWMVLGWANLDPRSIFSVP